jgi:uncharacterized damage-inducible protein DinB
MDLRDALLMNFRNNHWVLSKHAEGLSHEESVVRAGGGGNSFNWVLGHIVTSRNDIFALLGEPPVWSEADAARYVRGSHELDPAAARQLAAILADLDRSQERLLARLEPLAEAELAAARGDSTLGKQLAFLQFHETYHVGQTGLLRRLAGKEGVIR